LCVSFKSFWAWNNFQKLDAFLKSIQFVRNDANFNMYVAHVRDVKFFIVVYFDDHILVCNNNDKLASEGRNFSKVWNEKSW
jgi:hypothetical protein